MGMDVGRSAPVLDVGRTRVSSREMSSEELRRRLAKWSLRGPKERALQLSACLERSDLERLFSEALAEGERRRSEQAHRAHRVKQEKEQSTSQQGPSSVQRLALLEDCRTAMQDVQGVLVYLELPPSQATVHENDCMWPDEVDFTHRARAIRRHTTHTIRNARRNYALSLRSW